jgi:hypothetical protein
MEKGKNTSKLVRPGDTTKHDELPLASMQFRRRAWLAFQRALDPLGPPKPLPTQRRR